MVIIKSSKCSFKQMEFPVFGWIRHHFFTTLDARIRNVKCKNKNVLEVLKSLKYISLFEPRQSINFHLRCTKIVCVDGYKLARNEIFLRYGSSGDWGGFS